MLKDVCSTVAAVAMVFDTVIPVIVPSDELGWLRFKILLIGFGVVAVIAFVTQYFLQRSEDRRRLEREEARDEIAAEQLRLIERLVNERGLLDVSTVPLAAPKESGQLEAANPRIYVEIADDRLDSSAGFPKTYFVLSNHGGDVAHRVQIDALKLAAVTVNFPSVEIIPKGGQKKILPEIEDMGVFARNDIARLLMKEWDKEGQVTREFLRPVKVTYEDFKKNQFETIFDLVFFPIQDMLKRKHGTNWPKHERETLQVRNLVVRQRLTWPDIDKMSADEYKQRSLDAEFRRQVDALPPRK